MFVSFGTLFEFSNLKFQYLKLSTSNKTLQNLIFKLFYICLTEVWNITSQAFQVPAELSFSSVLISIGNSQRFTKLQNHISSPTLIFQHDVLYQRFSSFPDSDNGQTVVAFLVCLYITL